jgi:hypothetical protein
MTSQTHGTTIPTPIAIDFRFSSIQPASSVTLTADESDVSIRTRRTALLLRAVVA